jgi:hypothetical protein
MPLTAKPRGARVAGVRLDLFLGQVRLMGLSQDPGADRIAQRQSSLPEPLGKTGLPISMQRAWRGNHWPALSTDRVPGMASGMTGTPVSTATVKAPS